MRKALLALVLSGLYSVAAEQGDGTLWWKIDGEVWNARESGWKYGVVYGYVVGYDHGRHRSSFEWQRMIEHQKSKNSPAFQYQTVTGQYIGPREEDIRRENIPPFDELKPFVVALDQFYADYKNSKVDLSDALQIISAEVRGKDKAQIEKLIEFARYSGSGEMMKDDERQWQSGEMTKAVEKMLQEKEEERQKAQKNTGEKTKQ